MIRLTLGTVIVFVFVAVLVIADYATRNLSQWIGSVLP